MSLLSYQNANAVNIITWYGYLTRDIVNELEKKCGATISYDEYYTTNEFLDRLKRQNYSIAIFAQTGYNLVYNKIDNKEISLDAIKQKHYPPILNSIFNKKLPNNAGVFSIEAAGFLYDPLNIKINKNDSLKDILKQAKGKKIILIDNPIESMKFISPNYKYPSDVIKKFKELFEGIEIIISNDNANFLNDKDIVLVHTWMGNAYRQIKKNPHLKFVHHPSISYIGADLIASMDKRKETYCVAKELAGKEMNSKVISGDFVISPYGVLEDEKKTLSPLYLEINNYFYKSQFRYLEWTTRPSKEVYLNIIDLWERIKLVIQ